MAALDPGNRRRRPRGARYSQRRLDQALAGNLTRQNTPQGSAERSAANRAEYVRRVEAADARGISRSQARGHPGSGEPLVSVAPIEWSAIPTTVGVVDLTTSTKREATRVGQYLYDVRGLLEGEVEPKEFRRRWTRRVRSAGGYELEADPDRVLAVVFETGPGPVDRYRRLDAGQAR